MEAYSAECRILPIMGGTVNVKRRLQQVRMKKDN